jgi:type II secretory pathway pseudopilin PulG
MPRSRSSSAFTLIEMLVVVGIIVVVVLLALPVLNVLQGNRSVDTAQNQIQALLNEARMMAIGVQRDSGVFFYIDPNTRRVQTVLVQAAPSQLGDPAEVDVFLDLVHDHESVPLTLGLDLQVIDNATIPTGQNIRLDDGYIGFNVNDPNQILTIPYGGVILFDQHGQLVSRTYGFRLGYHLPPPAPLTAFSWSDMGKLLVLNSGVPGAPAGYFIPGQNGFGVFTITQPAPQSKFGLVLFSKEAFEGQGFSLEDTQPGGGGYDNTSGTALSGYNGAELAEETWIDQNSTPLMVNRYNGTLIRGE